MRGKGAVFLRGTRVGNPIEVVVVEAVNTTPSGRKSFKKIKETKMNQSPGLVASLAHFICLKRVKFGYEYHSHLFYQVR